MQRNTHCDGVEPVCNTCIRDGQLCAGFEPPGHVSESYPTFHLQSQGTEEFTPNPLLRAVSVIVSTPIWKPRAPGHHHHLDHSHCEWASQGLEAPIRSVIPKCIPPDLGVVQNTLPFISYQYARWIKHTAFIDPPPFIVSGLVNRLSISDMTFSLMKLGAKIIQSIMDKGESTCVEYEKPIDTLHWQACNTPEEGSSPVCAKGRLITAIELTSYKFVVSNSASGYSFLKMAVPLTIRVAYEYPQVWTKQGKISIHRILNDTTLPSFCAFLWMDTMASTFLGTTPLLCYDTSICEKSRSRHPMEWMNGCPREFIGWFGKLNEIRLNITRHGSCLIPIDWESMEKEIQAWKPVMDGVNFSRKNIARLAAVEGWRYAILIYLYVGICGVTTADHRVQSAVGQIIRLSHIMKQEAMYERHLFGPAIFAGICACSESQRNYVVCLVALQRHTRMWVLQVSDFVHVLLHLWAGAARGGHPITWDDYIRSRRAVLPVNE
ncbi:unnamed protein product [Rhizoctonia solani]|uniref:Uncharacterized protein n=1 Tax=Rhizoctonia solani TaxID=456999 RepID=A0A8H2WMI8_9AGAM|nr:unnamed protein product [Rhizoctonia solani]